MNYDPYSLKEENEKAQVSQQKEHSLSVIKHGTKLYRIPGMGILPGKNEMNSFAGDTLPQA